MEFASAHGAAASPDVGSPSGGITSGPVASGACAAAAWSASAVYTGGDTVTYNGSEYTAAYWNQDSEPDKNSGPQYSGEPWQSPVACSPTTCTPACSGMQCGSDGCGGSCGTCQAGLECNPNNQCVAPCVPACSGKQCGGDTCGGSCGTCAPGQTCNSDGACQANAETPTLLDVPLDPQQQTEWCWAASAEMVMGYLGTNVQQCAEANYAVGRTDCCTSSASAENACNQPGWPDWSYWGFNFEETAYGTALSFAQLEVEIAANRPVGFAWAWTGGGGHYMVATGTEVDDDNVQYVTINDPWAPNVGDQVTLTYDDWVAGPAGTDPTATVSYTHMADDYGITAQN